MMTTAAPSTTRPAVGRRTRRRVLSRVWVLFGAVVIVVSVVLHSLLMRRTWKPDKDEDPLAGYDESSGEIAGTPGRQDPAPDTGDGGGVSVATRTEAPE